MTDKFIDRIKPDWTQIERIRQETQHFVEARDFPRTVAEAVVMVLSELVENAIKYGHYQSPDDKIAYSLAIGRDSIIVEVTNPFAENENFQELDRTIQWIRGYQNPFQAYVEKVKEIAGRPLADMQSGLGLVRIAYQGQAIIDFYLKNDNSIAVSAVYHL